MYTINPDEQTPFEVRVMLTDLIDTLYTDRFTVQGRRWELGNGRALYAREARENFSDLIKIHDGRG